jgi:hypothetical protein
MRFEFENQILARPITPKQVVFHSLVSPLVNQPAGVGLQGVHAGVGLWRRVVQFQQMPRFLCAPTLGPPFHQPGGMRKSQMRTLNLQFFKQLFG